MKKRSFRSILLSVVMFLTMILSSTCFSGCSQIKEIKQDDPFRRLYEVKTSVPSDSKDNVKGEFPLITLSCYKMPLSLFVRVLSDRYSVGMVYSETLATKEITAEFKETDLISVLNVVSRQLNVDIVRVGNTFFVGSLRPEDRGILVRRVFGHDVESLNQVAQSMISTNGKASVTKSGVVVAADHESVIRRFSEMLDYLDTVEADTWIVQLCFVTLRKDALLEAGMDVTTSGTLSYNISENQIDLKDFKIDGIFNLFSNSAFADVYSSPMLLCRDGETATWQDGERVPIPRKTVSNEGTVSTTGYDYTDTGFIVNASVRRSKIGGRLNLRVVMSDIKSYVENAPVTSQTVYTLDVDLEQDKAYLLGELNSFRVLDTQENIAMFSRDRGKVVIQLWGQLYRINGGTVSRFKTEIPKTP